MDKTYITLPLFSKRQIDCKRYFIYLDGPKLSSKIPQNLNELYKQNGFENVQQIFNVPNSNDVFV